MIPNIYVVLLISILNNVALLDLSLLKHLLFFSFEAFFSQEFQLPHVCIDALQCDCIVWSPICAFSA
jgi:hypothetical protein